MIEEIRKWADNTLEKLCKECDTICCDTNIHAISFLEDDKAVQMFGEYGIPIVPADKVNEISSAEYIEHRLDKISPKLVTIEGQIILPPALVGIPQNDNAYHIYSENGLCPLYKNERCSVHKDSRRSNTCSEFPVHILKETDGITVQFYPTCPSINEPYIRRKLRKLFPEPDVFLSIHVMDNQFKNRPKKGKTLHQQEYGYKL